MAAGVEGEDARPAASGMRLARRYKRTPMAKSQAEMTVGPMIVRMSEVTVGLPVNA